MTSAFLLFLNLSITAGWMVLAVLLLRLCLKKAPRWITCVLWGLVALRLVLPFTIESSFSLIPTAETVMSTDAADTSAPVVNSGVESIDKPLNDWLQTPVKPQTTPIVQSPVPPISGGDTTPQPTTPDKPVGDTDATPEQPSVEDETVASQQGSAETQVKTVSRVERILQIAAPVWLVGIGLMLIYELLSVLRVRYRVLDAVRLRDNVWQSDRVASPFIFGLFRPRIYVPYGLDEPVLEQVLSHERAHLHRRDHWIKPFAFTLLAVYWYNPLLWVGYILLCRDIEVACDERVIRTLDEDTRRQYATALLQCGVERRSIAACPLAFGEVSIKQRIKSVLNYRKPLLWVIVASLVVCAVAAVCLLTVPKSKEDNKQKETVSEEEDIVVLSSKEIKPDFDRTFAGTDVDGSILSEGFDWLWEHAENADAKTPNVDMYYETNIPLVVCKSKVDLDALMDACSDEELGVDMRDWFDWKPYDDTYFEDKVMVWLFVPGYDLRFNYDYTVILEETNQGLRYAVTLDYESTSLFDPTPSRSEHLLLFETDRKLIAEAKSLTTLHEQAPYTLPTEEGLTMVPVGNADVDGDGEKEDIRIYHSELDWESSGWLSGYETSYLVVCKVDGTTILCEDILYREYSQCYLLPQKDGPALLLFVEAGNVEDEYSEEEFGVLSLKSDKRTVLDYRYMSTHPAGWNDNSFDKFIPYVYALSNWMEDAQLLYSNDVGNLCYGDASGDTPEYRPLCWLDGYRNSEDDTLQNILENVLISLGGESISLGEMDFDGDGDVDKLSVLRYGDPDSIFQYNGLILREADGTLLAGINIHYDYWDGTLGIATYVYRVTTESGTALKVVRQYADSYDREYSIYALSVDGMEYAESMSMDEWLEYAEAHDGKLLFYFQGSEVYFADDEHTDGTDDFLKIDATKYMTENYNPSIVAYNSFLRGQRVAYEYGGFDTMFYVSDLYATVNDKGIRSYALADVTGDGVPELITEGYSMSVFTYQSGQLLRLYESRAGVCETFLLSNGCLWEKRCGTGEFYWYTKFFEIGTTHTTEFGIGWFSYGDEYYVESVSMDKAEFDTKTATYFENAKSPALILWYDYATKQPNSPAMVQYLSLLENLYQNNANAYYALYDADGDGTQDLLVKVGETIVIGSPRTDLILSDDKNIDWVSFKDEPIYMVDMTFDGFKDVAVCEQESARGKSFAVLRWDTKQERLVKMKQSLINPAVDTEASVIRTSSSGDQIVSYSIWSYNEDATDFVCTHSLYFEENEQSTGDDDRMRLVVTENGVEKTLYVRGEPYGLDQTDPQVAPYYEPGSFWDLDGLQWEMYLLAKAQNGNYDSYTALLNREYADGDAEYILRDMNGDGQNELLVLEDGLTMNVYTMQDGYVRLLVRQEFASGTSRFLDTGDAHYPGLIYFCVGGGKDWYYYLSLDNVQDEEFVKIPLWTDNYAFADVGEEGRITILSDDEKLIELSRQAYQNRRDVFSAAVTGSALHSVPSEFVSVFANQQALTCEGETVLLSNLLSDRGYTIGFYAVVDMDGDTQLEMAVMMTDPSNDILILKKDGTSYYGHLFTFRGMYRLNTDGSFHWNNSASNYGCDRVTFHGDELEHTELWHVERDGNESHAYYVNGNEVSKVEFESATAEEKDEVNWIAWT